MEKYEVLGLLGEGCFGRVYKARQINNSSKVALKVISKRGRSLKEVRALRRECEIQRHLLHPNIIRMLDSFETDNEIVVITEFAHRELTTILSKEVYLAEEKVQAIIWDLISALYYLHSRRVLHRDLKPQNVLLDLKNNAKLCDFGFARNMSTGTHVLTSIKGTPLYMAPELIEEHPYDHSADLWSLGCIMYELLVGAPPFCTTSILQLIRKIRHEEIELPTFISKNCATFLKGLLQKDPKRRLTWPEILKHPFINGHVLILEDNLAKPLTRPLSYDTLQVKEQQREHCLSQKNQAKSSKSTEVDPTTATSKSASHECAESLNCNDPNGNIEEKLDALTLNESSKESCKCWDRESVDKKCCSCDNSEVLSIAGKSVKNDLNLSEDSSPIENEEWVVFLRRNIEEVMAGEITSLCQSNLAIVAILPLRNSKTSPKVLEYVASLFSLPFVVRGTSNEAFKQIKKVYLDIKLIPNLVYASKLLLKQKPHSEVPVNEDGFRQVDALEEDDLNALERIYVLLCHLVYLDTEFLSQFFDAVIVLGLQTVLPNFFLAKSESRIAADIMAIFTHALRTFPENFDLVSVGFFGNETKSSIDFVQLLRHTNSLLRERSCYFLHVLSKISRKQLETIWCPLLKDTLEALVYDSVENVRKAAEASVVELKRLSFYDKELVADV